MTKKIVRKKPPRSQKRAAKPARGKRPSKAAGKPIDPGAEILDAAAALAKQPGGLEALRRVQNAIYELAPVQRSLRPLDMAKEYLDDAMPKLVEVLGGMRDDGDRLMAYDALSELAGMIEAARLNVDAAGGVSK